jgi:metal-sulfur cluster biosynthetic enzyme
VYNVVSVKTGLNAERCPAIEVIDDEMARVLRAKTGAERLRIASGMYASARQMLFSHLRAEHVDWDEACIAREVVRRLSHGAA